MSLLQQINEASSQDLASLKKTISKDPRVSKILKPGLQLAEIDNKKEFVDTIKFLLLNNDSVNKFVKSRSGIDNISLHFFSNLRKTKPEDVDQKWVDGVINFTADLFKEHGNVAKGKVSRDARKSIDEWANSDRWRANISYLVQKELLSMPGLRPDKPVKLYRGLLFSESSLRAAEKYDGTIEKGNGLKFLESMRKGKAEVDLEWDKPSSWTTDRSIAEKFAQYGPASSEMGAIMQWLGRMANNRHIDGALGFVVSILASPDDILVDVDKLNSAMHREHGSEREMIVKEGTYLAKVVKKYTVTDGEVDPKGESDESLDDALNQVENFTREIEAIEIPESFNISKNFKGFHPQRFVSDFDDFKKLISKSSSDSIAAVFDKYLNAYKSTLGTIGDKISPSNYAGDSKKMALADRANDVTNILGKNTTHKSLVTADNSKGKGKLHTLSAEDARSTFNDPTLDKLQRIITQRGAFSDTWDANAFIDIGRALDVPMNGRLAQQGTAKQAAYIKSVTDSFFDKLGVTSPEDYKDAAKEMIAYLRRAHRNAAIIDSVERVRKGLKLK